MSLATLPQGHHHRGLQPAGAEGPGLQRLPLLGLGVPGAARSSTRAANAVMITHDQAGERGLGTRHLGDRAQGDVGGRPWTRHAVRCRAATGTRPGGCTATFELAALTGREEELLAQAGRGAERHRWSPQVLSRCVRRLGDDQPGARRGDARDCWWPTGSTCCCSCARPPSATRCAPISSARGRTAASRCRVDFAIVRRAGARSRRTGRRCTR